MAVSSIAVLFGIAGFVAVFLATRYVSLGSIAGSVVFLVSTLLLKEPGQVVAIASVVTLFVTYRHTPNIRRLISGKEPRTKL